MAVELNLRQSSNLWKSFDECTSEGDMTFKNVLLQHASSTSGTSIGSPIIYLDEYLNSNMGSQATNTPINDTFSCASRHYRSRRSVLRPFSRGSRTYNLNSTPHSICSFRKLDCVNLSPRNSRDSPGLFAERSDSEAIQLSPDRVGSKAFLELPVVNEDSSESSSSSESSTAKSFALVNEAVFVEMPASLNCPFNHVNTRYSKGSSKYNLVPLRPELPSTTSTPNPVELTFETTYAMSSPSSLEAFNNHQTVGEKFSPVTKDSMFPVSERSGNCTTSASKTKDVHVSRLWETIFGVLSELVTTERSYCNSLYVFSEVVAKNVCAKTNVTLKDLRLLFPKSLPDIYALHIDMLQQMDAGIERLAKHSFHLNGNFDLIDRDKPLPYEVLRMYLQRHHDSTKQNLISALYTQYLDEFTLAMKTMQRLLRQSMRFKQTLKKLRDHSACEGFDFAAFLLSPVQRLPRYLLLMKQLSRHFEKLLHHDRTSTTVTEALTVSKQVETMLHAILVQLDTRLASYLEYPSNELQALDPRRGTNNSPSLKRNKSLPETAVPDMDVKPNKKHSLWPRVKRTFSDKRIDSDRSIATPKKNHIHSRKTSNQGDVDSSQDTSTTSSSHRISTESEEYSTNGYDEHLRQSVTQLARTHFLEQQSLISIISPKIAISNHLSPKGDSNFANSVNTQTTPGLSVVAYCSASRSERNPSAVQEAPENASTERLDNNEYPTLKSSTRLSSENSVIGSERSPIESSKVASGLDQSTDLEQVEMSKSATPRVSHHLTSPSQRSSLSSWMRESSEIEIPSDFERTKSTTNYATLPPRVLPPENKTKTRINSYTNVDRQHMGNNWKFSLRNLFRWRVDMCAKNTSHAKKDPLQHHSREGTSTNQVHSSCTGHYSTQTPQFDNRMICFRIKVKHSRAHGKPRHAHHGQRQKQSLSPTVDFSTIGNSDVFIDEAGNVCIAV